MLFCHRYFRRSKSSESSLPISNPISNQIILPGKRKPKTALWKVSKFSEIEKRNKRCHSRERYKNLQRNERKILVDYRKHSIKCWKFYHNFSVSSHYHINSFVYKYFSCIHSNLSFDGIDTFLPFKSNELQHKDRFFNHQRNSYH